MAVSETQRRDLYTGLEDMLGPERANTLMALLPTDPVELVTKSDISALQSSGDLRFDAIDLRFEQVDARFEQVDARFDQVDSRLERLENGLHQLAVRVDGIEDRIGGRIDGINTRLDRLFLTLGVALIGMMTALLVELVLR